MYCLIATVSHSSVDPTEWNGVQCTRGGDIQAKELTSVTSGPRWATELASELQCLLDALFGNVAAQAGWSTISNRERRMISVWVA